MNDEIKEMDRILLNVKRDLEFSPKHRSMELFDKEEIKKILDYITNLQQERNNYKSRNEKAIEITNKIIDAGYDTNEVLTLAIKQLEVLQGSDKDE